MEKVKFLPKVSFESLEFTPAIISGELFPDNERTLSNVRKKAQELGLVEPNFKFGLTFRDYYDNEAISALGYDWIIVMHPTYLQTNLFFLMKRNLVFGTGADPGYLNQLVYEEGCEQHERELAALQEFGWWSPKYEAVKNNPLERKWWKGDGFLFLKPA